ncbi:MAG: glycosyl transferase family 2 [Frankiales bacterium]|nr:glycosyl transferase family 2 [Frankiales bacterium]
MTGSTDITVVLPTFRRPDALARVLAGLAAQVQPPPYRLVVVDNDPEPHPAPVLPEGALLVQEPVPGAAAARNRGIAETKTPLLAMLDDDVVPDPAWLRALAEPVLAGRADLVGGRVLLAPGIARPRWLSAGIEGYLTALDLGPDEAELAEDQSLLTASLLTRTALLREVGGFDLALGPRPGSQLVADDVQLVRALRAAGARARWVPAAVVVHDLPEERLHRRWLLKRAFLQGRSDWRVDREQLSTRRGRGTRVAASWWWGQTRRRMHDGLSDPAVAFHAACDTARTLGAVVEAASWRSHDGLSR